MTDLNEIFTSGREFWLGGPVATAPTFPAPRMLENSWEPHGKNAGRLVLQLSGITSISEAESLSGLQLFLQQAEFPALPKDTFLVRDLVDCALWDGDRHVGTIVGLELPVAADGRTRLTDAPDLLLVAPVLPASLPAVTHDIAPDTEPVLVPFVRDWLLEADIAAKRIVMRLPPGLFAGEEHPPDT